MAANQSLPNHITLHPEPLRSIASSTLTGSYQAVGTPLVSASRLVKFTNNTSTDVTISWDGVHDADYIPAGSFLLMDIATNKQEDGILYIAALTQFYAKGTAGTGSFYISSYYA